MKRLLISFVVLLSMALPMLAAVDGEFKYSYPDQSDIPYNLGYQYSVYDLGESPEVGWRVIYLEKPLILSYHITSEEDKTVEVVFDQSYMELEDILIPDKVIDPDTGEEYTVTAIGKMAFDDCPKIRSVIMGDSITRIEDYAFNMCENKVLHNLGFVRFSENLTHIGNYAFRNCHNLTTGHYTEGDQWPLQANTGLVGEIDYPFYGYGGRRAGLENYLLLPAAVEYIGKHAFEGCYLETFEDSKEDNNKQVKRVYGLTKVKIPNPSCVIDDYAFAGCQFLELITIGEELTGNGLKNPTPATDKKGRIGNYAFADCNLMRLDIPSSIESIGDNAFTNCFHRSREHTQGVNEGRIFLDNLYWMYPKSLFDNYDSLWHNWNVESLEDALMAKLNDYLDRWHTNTVTIHSDETSIGNNAFANNPQLEAVTINGSAGEFGSGAFQNCSNLKTVALPDDLTGVSQSMFMNCSALVSINIPDKVTAIGDSAFYQCKELPTLVLPPNLERVNPYTFYGCEWLSLSELPAQVNSIGDHAFQGCWNITSVTIPDNVTSIGEYAFAGCYIHEFIRKNDVPKHYTGLTEVIIGDGVISIGAHAFDGCRHLGQIEFGNSVSTIGDYAFQNCMSCPKAPCYVGDGKSYVENNDLTLPDSLTSIGVGAFQGCTHMPGITLSENMTELPDYAFAYCSELSSIENLNNITSKKENTFLGCYNLEDFGTLYDGEGYLVDGIIYNNEDCREVISALPNITEAIIAEGVVKIHDGAFANCGALGYVEFPASLQEIGSRAFENCTSLSYADLINVEMGEFVYAGCTGIGEVIIYPDFVQDLQDNWFAGCIYMTGIVVEGDNERYSSDESWQLLLDKARTTLLRAPSGIYDLTIPESVKIIGDYACSNCFNLSVVDFPATVTHIGAHAFDNCYWEDERSYGGLSNISFGNPAVTIGEYAFNNCKDLNQVTWVKEVEPEEMGSIGSYAFNNCVSLGPAFDNFNLAAIDSLAPYAFANLHGLEEIELPATLKTIGDHAFDSCQNLTSVEFPDSLKKIGNSAFKSSGLTSLAFPESIEEIGDSAFMDCSKIMALTLPSGLKKINPYTFYKCFSEGQFGTFEEISDENFNLSIEIPESVESIGDYAFYGCDSNSNRYFGPGKETYENLYHYFIYGLNSVKIGKNVKTIGAHAFDGCTHLLDVKMGDAVTSIGDYAFNDCFQQRFNGVREVEVLLYGTYEKALDEYPVVWNLDSISPSPVSLPEGLLSLGEGALRGCAELPSINFPASLTAIPDQAFNGCKSLTEIELPEGILSIGDGSFGGCKGVKEISLPASLENGSRVFVDCDSALTVTYHAEMPKTFDEAFFSPKVYSSKKAELYTPNALLENVKGKTPWALFYKIIAKDDSLTHLERVLEVKNGLRFRVLANKPIPYCEVAGPAEVYKDPLVSYEVPEFVVNTDPESVYFGQPYKVIRIGNDAFEDDLTLVGITIPETVFDIGQEAFNGCKNLAAIELPASITNMGERAFANCYGLTYFVVPPLVTRLNPEVLKDCRGLLSIRMHDNIEELCMGALMDCRHLRKFERSENWKLRLIDDYALKNCIELEEINIPEGVEKIGKEAMYYCQKLNVVSLPKSLKEIGENAFDDCEVLSIIKVYTEKTPTIIGEANLTEPQCKIYVQAKTLDAYKGLWKVHENRIEPGIIMTQPTQMPEYIPGNTYKISSKMPLEGQTPTWSCGNPVVATHDTLHDGTLLLKAVGRTPIHVETDQKFYHDGTLDVYPQVADANWDGRFDISDAVNIANYVVENKYSLANWNDRKGRGLEEGGLEKDSLWLEFYKVGANVNKDGDLSISDASAAVKEVLRQNPGAATNASPLRVRSSNGVSDALVIGAISSTSSAGYVVPVGLSNSIEYVAMQANIRVPEGMTLKAVNAGPRAANHALSTRRIDERTMRIVLFDLNNSAFAPSAESLVELLVEGDASEIGEIEIFGIVASDIASNSHGLSTRVDLSSSGVATVTDSNADVKGVADGLLISNAAGKTVTVYTIDGITLSSFVAASDSETVALPAGIYIVDVNGHAIKIAVK